MNNLPLFILQTRPRRDCVLPDNRALEKMYAWSHAKELSPLCGKFLPAGKNVRGDNELKKDAIVALRSQKGATLKKNDAHPRELLLRVH